MTPWEQAVAKHGTRVSGNGVEHLQGVGCWVKPRPDVAAARRCRVCKGIARTIAWEAEGLTEDQLRKLSPGDVVQHRGAKPGDEPGLRHKVAVVDVENRKVRLWCGWAWIPACRLMMTAEPPNCGNCKQRQKRPAGVEPPPIPDPPEVAGRPARIGSEVTVPGASLRPNPPKVDRVVVSYTGIRRPGEWGCRWGGKLRWVKA